MLDHATSAVTLDLDLQSLRGPGTGCAASAARETERAARLLRRCRAFAGIDSVDLAALARVARTRRFGRGEVVLRVAGAESGAQFAVLASGLVKWVGAGGVRGNVSGIISSIHGPGDALGYERAVARARETSAAERVGERAGECASEIIALSAGEALMVPVETLARAASAHAKTALAVARALVESAEVLRAKITVMSAGSVPQRLATLLLDLADRFGDQLEDGRWVVPIALSREDLARLVGTTVESAIRTMRKWERAELVVRDEDGGFVVRDRGALERCLLSPSDGRQVQV